MLFNYSFHDLQDAKKESNLDLHLPVVEITRACAHHTTDKKFTNTMQQKSTANSDDFFLLVLFFMKCLRLAMSSKSKR